MDHLASVYIHDEIETMIDNKPSVTPDSFIQQPVKEEFKPWGMSKSDFIMLMHLSQFVAGPILSYVNVGVL